MLESLEVGLWKTIIGGKVPLKHSYLVNIYVLCYEQSYLDDSWTFHETGKQFSSSWSLHLPPPSPFTWEIFFLISEGRSKGESECPSRGVVTQIPKHPYATEAHLAVAYSGPQDFQSQTQGGCKCTSCHRTGEPDGLLGGDVSLAHQFKTQNQTPSPRWLGTSEFLGLSERVLSSRWVNKHCTWQ